MILLKYCLGILLAIVVISSQCFAQANADAALGTWHTESQKSKVEIYKSGGKYFGKVITVRRTNEDGTPLLDTKNPDAKLRSRKIAGTVIMKDFDYAGDNVWEDGKIYDPDNGKTYSCKMTLVNKNQLEVRGYIGISLIGRTTTWNRVE
ncbi:MAG: DUF2147 domain-containing protein [Bacteroidota bacterium]